MATSSTQITQEDKPVTSTGLCRYDNTQSLLHHNLHLFARTYLLIDVLHTFAKHDPFMHGLAPISSHISPLSYPLLPTSVVSYLYAHPHSLLRSARLLISMILTSSILRLIFTLGPLLLCCLPNSFAFITDLLPEFSTYTEPYLYPDQFGAFASNIAARGLAGAWGGWWHQMFRFGFESAGKWAVRLPFLQAHGVDDKSATGKALALMVAFTVSGMLHACGSLTALGSGGRPVTASFLFFWLQGAGILVQMGGMGWIKGWVKRRREKRGRVWKVLSKVGFTEEDRVPLWLATTSHVLFTAIWVWLTGPLLAGDFARAGVWTERYLPFSPTGLTLVVARGLGFISGRAASLEEEGVWREVFPWRVQGWLWWYRGKSVLLSGLAF